VIREGSVGEMLELLKEIVLGEVVGASVESALCRALKSFRERFWEKKEKRGESRTGDVLCVSNSSAIALKGNVTPNVRGRVKLNPKN
jgi:hypothetical protein